jgi:hypothetical protein
MALLVAAVAAVFWPGLPMYDTVAQYGQVLGGDVDDWHPPIMVRLWQLLHPLGSGAAPMFILQVALYALGFALIVAALVQVKRPIAAVATAVLALSPMLLGWQMVVIKDAQMQGALVAAFGIVAHYRLHGHRMPHAALAATALLLLYATLVRANAVFVTVPLVLALLPRPLSLPRRGAAGLAAILLIIGVSPIVNHVLLGADQSGIAKTQPMFDLAAIAVATPDARPFTAPERAVMVRRHCVKNFFWDPIGDPSACGSFTARVNAEPQGKLYLDLARAAASHPVAYAEHRLRHWNSSERWLVAPGLPDIGPPDEAEPNDILATPASPLMPAWQSIAAVEAATPFGWPIVWTVLCLCLLPAAWHRREEPAGNLALALLASALGLEASFLVISIASDTRYHLWPMAASALALILLSDRFSLKRWERIAAVCVLALVIIGGIASRAVLPKAPDTYQGMIHSLSG